MGINIWFIFASILLVSARARRYDQGPHTLYDFSTGLATSGPYGQRELVLYLTPDQVRSLQADGAVVNSDKDDGNDSEVAAVQQENEEQDDENNDDQEDEEETDDSQEENDDTQEEEENDDSQAEDAQQEEESPEERKSQNIDFEAILRLLNEEQVDEEAEQPSNDSQIEAENAEEPRNFSPRFTLRRQQHEQKNVALTAAKKEQLFKTYSNIRYQPYGQRHRFDYQLRQQGYETRTPEEFDEKLIGTPLQGTKKYKLVPYKIEEPVEELRPTVNAQQQNSEAVEEVQTAITSKRLRDELRKYALRVQKLKNSEKTREEASANSKATSVPVLIKQQQSRKSKAGKTPVRSVDNKQTKPKQPKSIAVPVMVAENSKVQKPIKVPVETNKLVRNKTRKVNGNKKENSEEAQKNKPEKITILRQFRG